MILPSVFAVGFSFVAALSVFWSPPAAVSCQIQVDINLATGVATIVGCSDPTCVNGDACAQLTGGPGGVLVFCNCDTPLASVVSMFGSGSSSSDGLGVVVPSAESCKCASSSDCTATHASDNCSTGTPCVHYQITPSGSDTAGTCYKAEVCPADATPCRHRSFSVVLTVGGCSGMGQPTCCTTTRAADPNATPPIPAGTGCIVFSKDGTDVGMRCAGENITITLDNPSGLACDDDGDVRKVIKANCPADNDLELEVTAVFRCTDCAANKDG